MKPSIASDLLTEQPLQSLDEWDDFVATRYKQGKSEEEFRNYASDANPTVTEFYRQNHAHQTLQFVLSKRDQYLKLQKGKKSIWEAAEYLNTLVDDSDPDTDLSQIEHLLQTSEAIRHDGHPRWFVLTGFIHDLGKVSMSVWRASMGSRGRHLPGWLRLLRPDRVSGVLRGQSR